MSDSHWGEAVSAFLCVSGLVDLLKEGFVLLPGKNTQRDYERMFQISICTQMVLVGNVCRWPFNLISVCSGLF